MQKFAKERVIGIQAVLKASYLCQSVFNKLVKQTLNKKDKSPVTVADFGAQAVVNHLINSKFPMDPIVGKFNFNIGEEDSLELVNQPELLKAVVELVNETLNSTLTKESIIKSIDLGSYEGGGKRFWTLDPIDGTKGFLRGEQFAVCLALVEDGIVQMAVQGCPNLPTKLNDPNSERGVLFIAVKGQGAFQVRIYLQERTFADETEHPIHVSSTKDSSELLFCESVEAEHSSHSTSSRIAQELGITRCSVRMDSQCKYGVVSRGEADIYLRIPTRMDYEEKIWDHAGGSLLIKESGGEITDIYGNQLDFSKGRTLKSKGIVASNNKFHSKIISAIEKALNQ